MSRKESASAGIAQDQSGQIFTLLRADSERSNGIDDGVRRTAASCNLLGCHESRSRGSRIIGRSEYADCTALADSTVASDRSGHIGLLRSCGPIGDALSGEAIPPETMPIRVCLFATPTACS